MGSAHGLSHDALLVVGMRLPPCRPPYRSPSLPSWRIPPSSPSPYHISAQYVQALFVYIHMHHLNRAFLGHAVLYIDIQYPNTLPKGKRDCMFSMFHILYKWLQPCC